MEPSVAPSVQYEEGPRVDAYTVAERVVNRMRGESPKWKGWQSVRIVPVRETRDAMRAVIGPRGTGLAGLQNLAMLASRMNCQYIAYYRLTELTGARTRGFGARVTGRAQIDLRVYDAQANALVWMSRVTETSTKTGSQFAMEPRVEQALLNALRKALDPHITEGLMKPVPSNRTGLGK